MSADSPREAVLQTLSRPRGTLVSATPVADPRSVRTGEPAAAARPALSRGGPPYAVNTDTVRFVVERKVADRHFFVVTFEAEFDGLGPTAMYSLVISEQDAGGAWTAHSIAGGSGDGSSVQPSWTEPRVNLGGSWRPDGFRAGGQIHYAGADVARVRLSFSNGSHLEDIAESGWVFFFAPAESVTHEATVELLDASGATIASHPWGLRPPG